MNLFEQKLLEELELRELSNILFECESPEEIRDILQEGRLGRFMKVAGHGVRAGKRTIKTGLKTGRFRVRSAIRGARRGAGDWANQPNDPMSKLKRATRYLRQGVGAGARVVGRSIPKAAGEVKRGVADAVSRDRLERKFAKERRNRRSQDSHQLPDDIKLTPRGREDMAKQPLKRPR